MLNYKLEKLKFLANFKKLLSHLSREIYKIDRNAMNFILIRDIKANVLF